MQALILKTFVDAGCFTHLVGCRASGHALLVDPKHGRRDAYRATAADLGLRIVAVLDTHTHADHLSDSHSFTSDGVELLLSEHSASRRLHRKLVDGEELRVGELRLQALHVPGHTADSIALQGHGLVVTGDTLLLGGLARADFTGADAAQLYDSVGRKLLTLPDETIVLPGHGYDDVLFSTIGHERRFNPDLQFASGAEFARSRSAAAGSGDTDAIRRTIDLNLSERPRMPSAHAAATACCAAPGAVRTAVDFSERSCEELAPELARFVERDAWLDVRDEHEFRASRIPGALSYPLSELGFRLADLRRSDPVVLQCRSGVRSRTAARTLRYLGVMAAPINLAGGLVRWGKLGLPLQ